MKTRLSTSRRRASALVISLVFVVLMTIIVLAITVGVQVERVSANSHLEKARTEFLSQMALDDVVARLQSATGNTNVAWISQPGRLVASDTNGTNRALKTEIPLYSGIGASNSPALNIPTFDNPTNFLIFNSSSNQSAPMQVAWTSVTNSLGQTNGRYAFWVDDESSKVNYNLAWGRQAANTNAPGSPTKVNLEALEGFDSMAANTLHRAVTADNYQTASFFQSPYDARRLTDGNMADLLLRNNFNLTHYSHDPDTTFFNEPRIVLTTQEKYAPRDASGNILKNKDGIPYFLDILKTPNSDPGGPADSIVDSAKLNKTIALLTSYLKRNDWPMTSGPKSLQDKYYGGATQRLIQMSLNVIDYVRSKESALPVVYPLRGSYNNEIFKLPSEDPTATGNVFLGVARTPLITELSVLVNTAKKELTFKIELHLPANYGLASIDFSGGNWFLITQLPQGMTLADSSGQQSPWEFLPITPSECSNTLLKAGEYITITRTRKIYSGTANPPSIKLRVLLQVQQGSFRNDVDFAPLEGNPSAYADCPLAEGDSSTAESSLNSIQVIDPRVNKYRTNWKFRPSTFGQQNSNYLTADSAAKPQQDTKADGVTISDASLYMPPPAGSAGNLSGTVSSSAELGYIHTGIEGTVKAGVPWRTLRLQPNSASNTSDVPDWAFMDLFTVPAYVPPAGAALFQPHGSAAGGRININAATQPFNLERTRPIAALLQGAQKGSSPADKLSAAEAQTIASNIYHRTLAAKGKSYGWADAYDSPGEIVEIAGIADAGEESEELVRSLANLVTARSNVFSVYTIAQSLNPVSGRVTGEQRTQFMIERYADNGRVRFRTLYVRPLNP